MGYQSVRNNELERLAAGALLTITDRHLELYSPLPNASISPSMPAAVAFMCLLRPDARGAARAVGAHRTPRGPPSRAPRAIGTRCRAPAVGGGARLAAQSIGVEPRFLQLSLVEVFARKNLGSTPVIDGPQLSMSVSARPSRRSSGSFLRVSSWPGEMTRRFAPRPSRGSLKKPPRSCHCGCRHKNVSDVASA